LATASAVVGRHLKDAASVCYRLCAAPRRVRGEAGAAVAWGGARQEGKVREALEGVGIFAGKRAALVPAPREGAGVESCGVLEAEI
jgi:hypothetical protein